MDHAGEAEKYLGADLTPRQHEIQQAYIHALLAVNDTLKLILGDLDEIAGYLSVADQTGPIER